MSSEQENLNARNMVQSSLFPLLNGFQDQDELFYKNVISLSEELAHYKGDLVNVARENDILDSIEDAIKTAEKQIQEKKNVSRENFLEWLDIYLKNLPEAFQRVPFDIFCENARMKFTEFFSKKTDLLAA